MSIQSQERPITPEEPPYGSPESREEYKIRQEALRQLREAAEASGKPVVIDAEQLRIAINRIRAERSSGNGN